MGLVAAGVSFRTAPLEVRERAAISDEDAPKLLRYLIGHGGLRGAAVLSTCNRTEFYVASEDDEPADEVGRRVGFYIDPAGAGPGGEHVITREGPDAVAHLFRVAAGLESMIVGEAQVLGQFKAAHRLAREAGTLDARLDFVMRRAVSVAKRVRTETSIGRGVSSLSEAALDCARDAVGDLRGRGVLLVGAGKMSSLAARRLRELGSRILVTSRSESAERLARSLGGTAVSLDELEDIAPDVDVVLASTTSPDLVVHRETVEEMQRVREHRPLCIVDIAVPRDVDPAAAHLPGVSLIDIDELGRRLEGSLATRRDAVPEAERIIDIEVRKTIAVLDERDATAPTIAALIRHAEALRRREVDRTTSRGPALDPEVHARVDALTQSLIRKLLHAPIAHLRDNAGDPAAALQIRETFGLDEVEVNGARRDTGQRSGPRAG